MRQRNCLRMDTLYLASMHFDSIDDHVNFVMSSPRLRFNMGKFFYNPVSVNKATRGFFPSLKTLHRYSEEDESFDDDEKIIAREVWYPYDWTKKRAPNTTYHNLVLTREYVRNRFANKENISVDDWPKINGNVALGDECFRDNRSLQSIALPDYVTRLGNSCFSNCDRLGQVVLPAEVKELGEECFKSCCALSCIRIPETVSEIQPNCFYNCALTSIELPIGITRLKRGTFNSCDELKQLILPQTLKEIGPVSVVDCTNLTSLTIPESVQVVYPCAFLGCIRLNVINKSNIRLSARALMCATVETVGQPKWHMIDLESLLQNSSK